MAINRNFQIKNGITVGTNTFVSSGSSVGIGTTNPSTSLQVVGTISATTFFGSGSSLSSIPNSALNNSTITINTSTGLTGGGTIALGGTLNISNTGTGVTSLAVSGNGISINGSTGALTISSGATSINTPSTLIYRDTSGNFSAGTITATLSGNSTSASVLQTSRTLWGQNFDGSANISGNLSSVGNITGSSGVTLTATFGTLGLVATGANPITFSTNSNEAVRIDSGGNVGIGTANPLKRLTIRAANDDGITLTRPSNASIPHLNITTTESGGDAYSVLYDTRNNNAIFSTYVAGATGGNIIFKTDTSNGTTERLRIDSSGNLGIGTNSPSQKFHVVGNSRITGAQYDSNNSAGSSGQYLQSTGTGTSWSTINTSAITSKAIAMSIIFGI